jgi:hypothetical protein
MIADTLERLVSAGPEGRLLRALLFAGPFVVLAFSVGGRSTPLVALVAAYVLAVPAYVGWRALVGED